MPLKQNAPQVLSQDVLAIEIQVTFADIAFPDHVDLFSDTTGIRIISGTGHCRSLSPTETKLLWIEGTTDHQTLRVRSLNVNPLDLKPDLIYE